MAHRIYFKGARTARYSVHAHPAKIGVEALLAPRPIFSSHLCIVAVVFCSDRQYRICLGAQKGDARCTGTRREGGMAWQDKVRQAMHTTQLRYDLVTGMTRGAE
ncbi:uncharacterized protein PgNI_04688 [Pyricularia grisea]|uniref:Uncharacterized protein n=1 Tax=Pyricularia grisea TaxID=148305 RepID=A0A6P8BBU8_PYRGI|nr:uncharacterized protein PgNI_04688 [Pyricularia grisea]TLD13157.1 hypothetical protein PgNI_04688 [Pyricularia grisea]